MYKNKLYYVFNICQTAIFLNKNKNNESNQKKKKGNVAGYLKYAAYPACTSTQCFLLV